MPTYRKRNSMGSPTHEVKNFIDSYTEVIDLIYEGTRGTSTLEEFSEVVKASVDRASESDEIYAVRLKWAIDQVDWLALARLYADMWDEAGL